MPEKTIKLNFRSMSQRQVQAMAAGTILAGGGTLDVQKPPGGSPVFPKAQTGFDLVDQLREAQEQRERDRRAEEMLADWRTNSDDLLRNGSSSFDNSPSYSSPSEFDVSTPSYDNSSDYGGGNFDTYSAPDFG